MNVQILRNELQDVLSGKSSVRFGGTLQSIARHLGNGAGTSRTIEDQKRFKKQEEESLIPFIADNQLWLHNIDFSQYVSEGAEQRVFLQDDRHVIKLNDAIYYQCWLEYIVYAQPSGYAPTRKPLWANAALIRIKSQDFFTTLAQHSM